MLKQCTVILFVFLLPLEAHPLAFDITFLAKSMEEVSASLHSQA